MRSLRRRWGEAFEDVPDDVLRTRPAPDVWSALEYAAHTRDVIRDNAWEMAGILDGALGPEPPEENEAGYNLEDPETVLAELGDNAERMADRAEEVVVPDQWTRTLRSGSDAEAGEVLRHAVHDATHHLKDVGSGLRSLRS